MSSFLKYTLCGLLNFLVGLSNQTYRVLTFLFIASTYLAIFLLLGALVAFLLLIALAWPELSEFLRMTILDGTDVEPSFLLLSLFLLSLPALLLFLYFIISSGDRIHEEILPRAFNLRFRYFIYFAFFQIVLSFDPQLSISFYDGLRQILQFLMEEGLKALENDSQNMFDGDFSNLPGGGLLLLIFPIRFILLISFLAENKLWIAFIMLLCFPLFRPAHFLMDAGFFLDFCPNPDSGDLMLMGRGNKVAFGSIKPNLTTHASNSYFIKIMTDSKVASLFKSWDHEFKDLQVFRAPIEARMSVIRCFNQELSMSARVGCMLEKKDNFGKFLVNTYRGSRGSPIQTEIFERNGVVTSYALDIATNLYWTNLTLRVTSDPQMARMSGFAYTKGVERFGYDRGPNPPASVVKDAHIGRNCLSEAIAKEQVKLVYNLPPGTKVSYKSVDGADLAFLSADGSQFKVDIKTIRAHDNDLYNVLGAANAAVNALTEVNKGVILSVESSNPNLTADKIRADVITVISTDNPSLGRAIKYSPELLKVVNRKDIILLDAARGLGEDPFMVLLESISYDNKSAEAQL